MTDIPKDTGGIAGLGRIDKPLFAVTGSFILLFCGLALVSIDILSAIVDRSFGVAATYFGFYWQLLLLGTFLMGIVICLLPGARTVMGDLDTPEFSSFQWGSMLMGTLLAGGRRVLGGGRAHRAFPVHPAPVR